MNKKTRHSLSVGDVAEASAGRGKGRKFLVVEKIDREYVLISDGDTRKLGRSKKKKNLHLRPIGHIDDVSFLKNSGGTADSEIRKILKLYDEEV